LNCKSLNFDRTQSTCHIFAVGQANANVKKNPSVDFYEFNCGKLIKYTAGPL